MNVHTSSDRLIRITTMAVVLAILLLVFFAAPAFAGSKANVNPGILPPQSHPHGASYVEWGVKWWQWAYSYPEDINPVLDPDGSHAAVGQSGPVWFLAGSFFAGTYERTVTIPAGKALFFPLVDYSVGAYASDVEGVDYPYVADIMKSFEEFMGQQRVTCRIDGVDLRDLTRYSVPFGPEYEYSFDLPDDALWGIQDIARFWHCGIYLMVAPLSAGEHTIHFTAEGFLDVTYHLTVRGGVGR